MSPRPDDADFAIDIGFQAVSDTPSRVFRTMAVLIEAFETVDRERVNFVVRVRPAVLLEDLEAGSI
jgi:hypothetical protein